MNMRLSEFLNYLTKFNIEYEQKIVFYDQHSKMITDERELKDIQDHPDEYVYFASHISNDVFAIYLDLMNTKFI